METSQRPSILLGALGFHRQDAGQSSSNGAGHGLRQPATDKSAIFTPAIRIMESRGDDNAVPQKEAPEVQVIHFREFVKEVGEDLRILTSHNTTVSLGICSEKLRGHLERRRYRVGVAPVRWKNFSSVVIVKSSDNLPEYIMEAVGVDHLRNPACWEMNTSYRVFEFILTGRVVMQEGAPSLAGWPPSFDHVLGDARLRDLKPELEQFAVDARRAPKWVLDAHPPDQLAQLRFNLRSPSQWARLPTPVAAKSGFMPTHEVSGRMIVRISRIDGNQRYSWINNKRSWFVNRTRPCGLRLKTID